MERNIKEGTWKTVWSRYKYVALVVAIGVALLAIPFGGGGEKPQTQTEPASTEQISQSDLEEQMQTILSKISGVGELHLMLTLESGAQQQLAQDTELSYSGTTAAPDDYTRRSETVIVSADAGDAPVVTATGAPTYRGALVVCQGGGDPQVQLSVTQAVAALTGLSSDRITVMKCQ